MSNKGRRLSLRQAINDQCKDCVFDPREPGTWLDQVAGCRGYSCKLYPVRPGRERLEKLQNVAATA